IRFEGALAPEHFGFVLAALYNRGKISLKKHIAIESNISDVIAAESLAPKGVVSQSLAQFLCRTNPHICQVPKEGGERWSNSPATINYKERDIKCGDLALPKYVFCVPNVRLASYRIAVVVPYDARRESLKDLVVSNLGGCDTWDQACRSLVQALNRTY